jgi:hypothetical protein
MFVAIRTIIVENKWHTIVVKDNLRFEHSGRNERTKKGIGRR